MSSTTSSTPGYVTAEVHIAITPRGAAHSVATVAYRYTALSEAGNTFIAHWAEEFPHQAPHWAEAINKYLETRRTHEPR